MHILSIKPIGQFVEESLIGNELVYRSIYIHQYKGGHQSKPLVIDSIFKVCFLTLRYCSAANSIKPEQATCRLFWFYAGCI